MGKWTEAEQTGQCYNCDKEVGYNNLVSVNCWPVCVDCAWKMESNEDTED